MSEVRKFVEGDRVALKNVLGPIMEVMHEENNYVHVFWYDDDDEYNQDVFDADILEFIS